MGMKRALPWVLGKNFSLPFLPPDLYHAVSEGDNVTGTQPSFIKGPEGNYTAATRQSNQPLEDTGQRQAWVSWAPWAWSH